MAKGKTKTVILSQNEENKKSKITFINLFVDSDDDEFKKEAVIFFRNNLTANQQLKVESFKKTAMCVTAVAMGAKELYKAELPPGLDDLIKCIDYFNNEIDRLFAAKRGDNSEFKKILTYSATPKLIIGLFTIKMAIQLKFYKMRIQKLSGKNLDVDKFWSNMDSLVTDTLGVNIMDHAQIMAQLPSHTKIANKLLGEMYELLTHVFDMLHNEYAKIKVLEFEKIKNKEQQMLLQQKTILFTKYTLFFTSKYLEKDKLVELRKIALDRDEELTKLVGDLSLEFRGMLNIEKAICPQKLYLASDISVVYENIKSKALPVEDAVVLTNNHKVFFIKRGKVVKSNNGKDIFVDVSKLNLPFPKIGKNSIQSFASKYDNDLCRYACDKANLILIPRVKWYIDFFNDIYPVTLKSDDNLVENAFSLLNNLHKYPELEGDIFEFIKKHVTYEKLTKQHLYQGKDQSLLHTAYNKGFSSLVEWFFNQYAEMLKKDKSLAEIIFPLLDSLGKHPEIKKNIFEFITKHVKPEQFYYQGRKQTLLHAACSNGLKEVVNWFFEKCNLFELKVDNYNELLKVAVIGNHEQTFKCLINIKVLYDGEMTEGYLEEFLTMAKTYDSTEVITTIEGMIKNICETAQDMSVDNDEPDEYDVKNVEPTVGTGKINYEDNKQLEKEISRLIQAAWKFERKKQKDKMAGFKQIESYVNQALCLISGGDDLGENERNCYEMESYKLLMILYNNIAKFVINNALNNCVNSHVDENTIQIAVEQANYYMGKAMEQQALCGDLLEKQSTRNYRLDILVNGIADYAKRLCDPLLLVKNKISKNNCRVNNSYAPAEVKQSFVWTTGQPWERSINEENMSQRAKDNKKIRYNCKRENQILTNVVEKMKSNKEKAKCLLPCISINDPYDCSNRSVSNTPKWDIKVIPYDGEVIAVTTFAKLKI